MQRLSKILWLFVFYASAMQGWCDAKRDARGVTLGLEGGTSRVQVLADRIVRVIYAADVSGLTNESFVVKKDWPKIKFTVEEKGDAVFIRTKSLMVRVNKPDGGVRFYDAQGGLLLAEKAGGRKLTGNGSFFIGEDTFESPPDEVLYGLGQYQEGMWNWRGLPREFRQHNMTVSLPMLLSSKGYGLLWDNASLTDFNPLSEEIRLTNISLAPTNSRAPAISTWTGRFTNEVAGERVFFAHADNNRQEFSINIDGQEIIGISNYWTPFTLCGTATLPADKVCEVRVRGGRNVRLFTGRRSDLTVFRSKFAKAVDYTFFYGPDLDEVVRGYRAATGEVPMWPEWAFGFWQCRERYSSQEQLLAEAAEFRRRAIPIDLIVQDWKYWGTNGWGSYEWDTRNYPRPAEMVAQLHAENIRFMISVWCNPHGKTLFDLTNNTATVGEWVDVFNPAGNKIRWEHMNDAFFKIGTDAWWCDATEPGDTGESFAGRTTKMGSSDYFRNAYSLFANEALYQNQRATDEAKRVCILTRSGYPGLQRAAAAVWSGDIAGNWVTLRRQIPAGLNFCLTGIPYWTTDCGGFWHPAGQYASADYNELLARWFEWSTFCPVLRIHGGATETEMWKWLPETQRILLAYDELRHRLLPYLYSTAWRVTSEGYTMMRALPMDFPGDTKALAVSDEYMFGPAFLVAPVTEPQATNKSVYLPQGTVWYNHWTGEKYDGGRTITVAAPLDRIPLMVRGGAIIPLGPVVQYAGEKAADPIELRVYPGADGTFTLYEDEGDNYHYEHGVFATIPIRWDDKAGTLTIGKRTGKFPGMLNKRKFRLVWPGQEQAREIEYSGKAVTVHR